MGFKCFNVHLDNPKIASVDYCTCLWLMHYIHRLHIDCYWIIYAHIKSLKTQLSVFELLLIADHVTTASQIYGKQAHNRILTIANVDQIHVEHT